MIIGILHPGAMGADLGETLLGAGHRVLWSSVGRSASTATRAAAAQLADAGTLANLVGQADVIVSLCPPHAAVEVARSVAEIRSDGLLYVDTNSVAPRTVREIAALFPDGAVVDATLTGSPRSSNTTMWLSGQHAVEVEALFIGTRIRCHHVGADIGNASAFKMCAGLRSKVIPAIWATIIEAASAYGSYVESALRAHLDELGYDIDGESVKVTERAAKAWRWIGEMEESAKAMQDVGLPTGFSEAAALTYRRIASS